MWVKVDSLSRVLIFLKTIIKSLVQSTLTPQIYSLLLLKFIIISSSSIELEAYLLACSFVIFKLKAGYGFYILGHYIFFKIKFTYGVIEFREVERK